MADIEEKLKSREIGEVKIDRIRIWNLACANDVLLLKNREAMQNMILLFKKFLKDRNKYDKDKYRKIKDVSF